MPGVVLLSGGMDSCVALFWATQHISPPVHGLFVDYGQVAMGREVVAAAIVYSYSKSQGEFMTAKLDPADVFTTDTSILGRSPINEYTSVEEAIAGTASDRSYLPMRNAILITLAAHRLLALHPKGGSIIIGTRSRHDAAGGFPDCTNAFARAMGTALTEGAGVEVVVRDPLNLFAPTRVKTLQLALVLPGCFEALAHTITCFRGYPELCGSCLPCLRRAQAFAELGMKDPAYEKYLVSSH